MENASTRELKGITNLVDINLGEGFRKLSAMRVEPINRIVLLVILQLTCITRIMMTYVYVLCNFMNICLVYVHIYHIMYYCVIIIVCTIYINLWSVTNVSGFQCCFCDKPNGTQ